MSLFRPFSPFVRWREARRDRAIAQRRLVAVGRDNGPPGRFDICFRSCSRVEAASGSASRFLGVPKQELLLSCLRSLLRAVEHAYMHYPAYEIRLTILDDHSSAEAVAGMRSLLDAALFPTDFRTLTGTGNGQSIRENYLFAREHCPGLIYFCEDDYLHAPEALTELLQTYDLLAPGLSEGLILHPYDCPDRYLNPEPHGQYPARILLGHSRHWRTVVHTTGTFVTSQALLRRYWDDYIAFGNYGVDPGISEDNTINRIYTQVVCLSPLPSLAVHLQYDFTLSPFVPWRQWWEQSAPDR